MRGSDDPERHGTHRRRSRHTGRTTIIADLDLGAAALPLAPPDGGDATDPLRILGLVPAHDGVTLYLCLESTDPETLQDLPEGQAVADVESVATDSDYRVVAVTIPTSSSWFLAALDSPEIALLQGGGADGG
ncbi:hypothetical protein [Haloplanus salilacus]|uniref:hypothetical protein n=1 Tax=Haloplanus salilacus TaxID=2949994 RepID=UPI0030CE4C54